MICLLRPIDPRLRFQPFIALHSLSYTEFASYEIFSACKNYDNRYLKLEVELGALVLEHLANNNMFPYLIETIVL